MALDSLRDVDNSYVSRIHSRRTSGKLHKGNSIAAPNASIPSRYQTIITDNSDRKGFLSKAKRFNHEAIIDDNPGPGTYVNQTKTETVSTSFSKRGTGGFASKSKREQKVGPTPGPGSAAYQLPSLLQSKKDFNNAYTRVFHKPIAQPVTKLSAVPAPNEYEVLRYKPGKANNVSAQAAFKSQSKREVMDTKESAKKPAPWQYHVDDKLLRDSIKVPFSSFKSTSKRQMAPDPPPYPGPGTYKPHEAVEESANKLILPRKHYLCISAPAMPLPPAQPQPGPGSYELVDFDGAPKHFMSSSMFVSSSSRWTGDIRGTDLPGPAHYHPDSTGKQSFIYNSVGRWI